MEPTLPAPNLNPERAPVDYGQDLERAPLLTTPERAFEHAPEQLERQGNLAPPIVNDDASTLPTPVVVPVPTVLAQDDVAVNVDDASGPTIAADDDVIEKEWVDKAKKIIAETKDDPHTREREVAKLQIDYLRKRYGKELGTLDA